MTPPATHSAEGARAHLARDAASERRATFQLIRYWEEMRADRTLPVEDDLDPDHDVLRNIWGQCFVVQVRDFEKLDFNYTYLGPDIIDAYRDDQLEGGNDRIVSLTATKLMDMYQQLVETKRPIVHMGEYTNPAGTLIKFRQCMLPFGKNGRVDVILGHMTYQLCA